MVYVEGNCVMNTYEDAETGKSRSSLNVYQSKSQPIPPNTSFEP